MSDTFDAALATLRREQFYVEMAAAETALRADPAALAAYRHDRDEWLNADLT
jgi:hypothetical protein